MLIGLMSGLKGGVVVIKIERTFVSGDLDSFVVVPALVSQALRSSRNDLCSGILKKFVVSDLDYKEPDDDIECLSYYHNKDDFFIC